MKKKTTMKPIPHLLETRAEVESVKFSEALTDPTLLFLEVRVRLRNAVHGMRNRIVVQRYYLNHPQHGLLNRDLFYEFLSAIGFRDQAKNLHLPGSENYQSAEQGMVGRWFACKTFVIKNETGIWTGFRYCRPTEAPDPNAIPF